jgi:acyl carrier protein
MIKKIKKIIAKVLEEPGLENSLSDNADLINDVGLDSLQMIDFMLKIEEEFDIEMDFESLNFNDMRSIHKFGEYLVVQLNRKKNAQI